MRSGRRVCDSNVTISFFKEVEKDECIACSVLTHVEFGNDVSSLEFLLLSFEEQGR